MTVMAGPVVFVGGYSWSGEALRSMVRPAGAPPEGVVRPGEYRSAAAERSPSVTAGAPPEGVVRPGEYRSAAAERSPSVTAGARPVVVPTAAMFEGTGPAIDAVCQLLGSSDVDIVSIPRRIPPTDAAVNATLAAARLIVFPGESAIHLRSVLADTQAWDAVLQAWANGAILVGIGGAAAALADPMIDDRGGAFTLGLGVVTETAVLPHADRWGHERMLRTTRLVSTGVALITIDDDAALIWSPALGWEAHGNVGVTLNGGAIPLATVPPPSPRVR